MFKLRRLEKPSLGLINLFACRANYDNGNDCLEAINVYGHCPPCAHCLFPEYHSLVREKVLLSVVCVLSFNIRVYSYNNIRSIFGVFLQFGTL